MIGCAKHGGRAFIKGQGIKTLVIPVLLGRGFPLGTVSGSECLRSVFVWVHYDGPRETGNGGWSLSWQQRLKVGYGLGFEAGQPPKYSVLTPQVRCS